MRRKAFPTMKFVSWCAWRHSPRPLADGDAYDLIFDNDGAPEIADRVSLRVTDGLVKVTLHHLQIFERHDARRPRQGSL
jgi:hypothetical protein